MMKISIVHKRVLAASLRSWTHTSSIVRTASFTASALQGKDYTSSSQESSSSWSSTLAATAAAAVAVAGGSLFSNAQSSACEESSASSSSQQSPYGETQEHHDDDDHHNNPLHPFYRTVSKGGVKDPMTKYQRIAIIREMQLQQQVNSMASIQATSPVSSSSSSSPRNEVCIAPGESDEETKSKFQRTISRGGLRDPMTTFQQRAIERALLLQQEHEQHMLMENDNSSSHQGGPSVQATSSSSSPIVVDMDPDVEVEEKGESAESFRKRQLIKSGIKDPMTTYQQRVTEDMDEGGLRDPMTIYQQRAIQRAVLLRKQQDEEQEAEEATETFIPSPPPPPVYIQATSSVSIVPPSPVVSNLKRVYSKSGIKDPMTCYQRQADERELRKHVREEDDDAAAASATVVQATSTTSIVSEQDPEVHGVKEEKDQQQAVHTVQATSSNQQETKGPGTNGPRSFPTEMTPAEQRLEENARKAKQHSGALKLFSGNGNMSLALEITRQLGISLGKATVGRFADGEVNVVIHENVRGKDVYVVQPTCMPVNDNLMELLLIVSTLRRASARRITVVIPYYGYARQDRKMQARVPISAADVARLMESMGVDRVIAVDLHCGQIQGFFGPRVPVDNLDGGIVGLDYFGSKDLHNPVIVSPDAGGVYRAKKFKEGLEQKYDMKDLGLAMIVKQRARAGAVDQMDLVGDVTDCDCVIVDDMIDTAGTLCKAAEVLVANGARRVFAFASHGLLSGPGNDRIANSQLEEVVILNTIPTTPQREANEKLTELSVAPLLAQAIFNIHAKKSISALFK